MFEWFYHKTGNWLWSWWFLQYSKRRAPSSAVSGFVATAIFCLYWRHDHVTFLVSRFMLLLTKTSYRWRSKNFQQHLIPWKSITWGLSGRRSRTMSCLIFFSMLCFILQSHFFTMWNETLIILNIILCSNRFQLLTQQTR